MGDDGNDLFSRGSAGGVYLPKAFIKHVWPLLTDEERGAVPMWYSYAPNIRPSVATIAKEFSKPVRSLQRASQRFRAYGILVCVEEGGGTRAAVYTKPDLDDVDVCSAIAEKIRAVKNGTGVKSGTGRRTPDLAPPPRQKWRNTGVKSGTLRTSIKELQLKNSPPAAQTGGEAAPQPRNGKAKALPAGADVPRKQATGAHAEVIAHFAAGYLKRYEQEYFFRPADGVSASTLLKACGSDLGKAKRVIDRYLTNTDKFYHGHPLTTLVAAGVLPKFLVLSGARNGKTQNPKEFPDGDITLAEHRLD